MCRLTGYIGSEVCAADLVLHPTRSIVRQSFECKERISGDGWTPSSLNGDGFGLGWYDEDRERDVTPCVYRCTRPAWNEANLQSLGLKIHANVLFAHVRAASEGMDVSESTCHPFSCGRFLFMHNGGISQYFRLRRRLFDVLKHDLPFNYAVARGSSDSAVIFALFLNCILDMHRSNESRITSASSPDRVAHSLSDEELMLVPVSPEQLRATVERVLQILQSLCEDEHVEGVSLLNIVVTDGLSMVGTRFTVSSDPTFKQCASLYFARGSRYEDLGQPKNGAYEVLHESRIPKFAMITSEPLSDSINDWIPVPCQSSIVITSCISVLIGPIVLKPGIHRPLIRDSLAMLLTRAQSRKQLCFGVSKHEENKRKSIVREHGDERDQARIQPSLNFGSGADLSVLEQHMATLRYEIQSCTDSVLSTAELPGEYLFWGRRNGSIVVWDLQLREIVQQVQHHRKSVFALRVDTKRRRVYSGSSNGVIREWKIMDSLSVHSSDILECIRTINCGRVGEIFSLSVLENVQNASSRDHASDACDNELQLLVASSDMSLRLLSVSCENCSKELELPSFTKPKVKLFNATFDPWTETLPEREIASLDSESLLSQYHYGAVYAVENAMNGDVVCSGCADGFIRMWCTRTFKFIALLRGHHGAVTSLAVVDDESLTGSRRTAECRSLSWLFSGSMDGTVRVWDVRKAVCRMTLQAHDGGVLSLSAFSDGRAVVSGGADMRIVMWCSKTLTRLRVIETVAVVESLCTSSSLGLVFCALANSSIQAWSVLDPEGIHRVCCNSQSPAPPQEKLDSSLESRVVQKVSVDDSSGNLSMEDVLARWVAIRSVSQSTVRKMQNECWNAAQFVAGLLESLGAEVKMQRPSALWRIESETTVTTQSSSSSPRTLEKNVDSMNPIVVATFRAKSPDAPTALLYGHYDVVNAGDTSQWNSDPWKMRALDSYFYGRGTTDNKGPLVAMIFAVKELLESYETSSEASDSTSDRELFLSHNIVFAIQGHGESGNNGFRELLTEYISDGAPDGDILRRTNLILNCNSLWVDDDHPCLTYGMRGVIDFEIAIGSGTQNRHAGVDGGAIAEPVTDLVRLLSSLKDSNGDLSVARINDLVRPISEEELCLNRVTLSDAHHRETLHQGTVQTSSSDGLLKARWFTPSLSVTSLTTSNTTDLFSVIPTKACAKVTIRTVPDQTPNQVIDALTSYLESEFRKLHSPNELSVKIQNVGDWWLGDPTSAAFQCAERAIEKAWNAKPEFVREGGSMPIAAFLQKELDAPLVQIPLGQKSDAAHLPNERIRAQNLWKGKDVIKNLLQEWLTIN